MPSFYPKASGRTQLPLTPPDFDMYSAGPQSAMAYQPAPYTSLHRNDNGYYDRLAWSYSREGAVFPPAGVFSSDVYGGKLAPILPPLVSTRPPTYGQTIANEMGHQPMNDFRRPTEQTAVPKPDKPVGGVSATLDYDMETMTDFVTEMANGIVQPGMNHFQNTDVTWRKWVHSVLCATRLPSATILLSLQYLAMRMQQLSRNGNCSTQPNFQRQRMLTVAFILGSKFLDDNTFINRSWAEVSGIEVAVLNYMELDWFQAMDHCLHREPSEPQGFNTWHEHWKNFELATQQRKANHIKLSPIDTTVQFQKSIRSSYSIPSFHAQPKSVHAGTLPLPAEPGRQYDPTTYTQYDSTWLYPRSATESSPASAPHTGPTTPEYYASAGPVPTPWPASGGYSRRTMFGFPASQPTVPGISATLTAPLQEPSFQYLQMYSGHHGSCQCYQCCYSPPRNYMQGYPNLSQPLSVAC